MRCAQIATALARGVHYTVDEKQRNVLLTEEGYEAAEDVLQVNWCFAGGLRAAAAFGECCCHRGVGCGASQDVLQMLRWRRWWWWW